MCWVKTCKRRSSQSTQDYHSIKFRLFLVTLGCGGSVTAFRLLCCVVMCLLGLALFANVFPHSIQSNVVSVLCFTNWFGYFMNCDFHDSDKMPKHVEMVRTKCQPKSWDGQNANHRKKSGQNANLWLALCPVGILFGWHFVLPPLRIDNTQDSEGFHPNFNEQKWLNKLSRPQIDPCQPPMA